MNVTYPYTIESGTGEKLIFTKVVKKPTGDRIYAENFVEPAAGPPMHIHWQQDESFTVIEGKIGYQIQGQPEQFAGPGDSVIFKKGVAHRFWNAGQGTLHCEGWVEPAHNFIFYISAIFAAQRKSGTERPEIFDAAYLLTRYASEFDMTALPLFVRKVIMPLTYRMGLLLGKYKHFEDAPEPLPYLPPAR